MHRVRHVLQTYGNWLRFMTMPTAAILLLIGVFVSNAWLLFSGAIMALIALHMVLRLIRGPVSRSETAFAERLQKLIADANAPPIDPAQREPRARLLVPKGSRVWQSRRSRRLFKDGRKRLMFDKDEVFIVELRRHPLSMFSPIMLVLMFGAVAKGAWAALQVMFSSWPAAIVSVAGLGVAGYFLDAYGYVLLGILLGILTLVVFSGYGTGSFRPSCSRLAM